MQFKFKREFNQQEEHVADVSALLLLNDLSHHLPDYLPENCSSVTWSSVIFIILRQDCLLPQLLLLHHDWFIVSNILILGEQVIVNNSILLQIRQSFQPYLSLPLLLSFIRMLLIGVFIVSNFNPDSRFANNQIIRTHHDYWLFLDWWLLLSTGTGHSPSPSLSSVSSEASSRITSDENWWSQSSQSQASPVCQWRLLLLRCQEVCLVSHYHCYCLSLWIILISDEEERKIQ